jgi:hypothetical protein
MRTNQILWALFILFGVSAVGVALYKSWPILFPDVAQSAPLDPGCDLRSAPCISKLPDGSRVSFSIEPRAIPVVKPLRLVVEAEGLEAGRVEIDFRGVDMNMGFNRPSLEKQENGVFSGKGMLPVCVRDEMEWEARVLLHTPRGLIAVPYRFWTYKPGKESFSGLD